MISVQRPAQGVLQRPRYMACRVASGGLAEATGVLSHRLPTQHLVDWLNPTWARNPSGAQGRTDALPHPITLRRAQPIIGHLLPAEQMILDEYDKALTIIEIEQESLSSSDGGLGRAGGAQSKIETIREAREQLTRRCMSLGRFMKWSGC